MQLNQLDLNCDRLHEQLEKPLDELLNKISKIKFSDYRAFVINQTKVTEKNYTSFYQQSFI